MDIVKTAKEVGTNVEKKLEEGIEVAKEAVSNIASHLPFVNLAKKDSDTFSVEVDLPGVKKSDIDIKIEDNRLVINAERKMKKEVKRKDYYLCESSFGHISRVFALPEGIDKEKVDASYEDGRLYVTLEKEAAKKARQISVK